MTDIFFNCVSDQCNGGIRKAETVTFDIDRLNGEIRFIFVCHRCGHSIQISNLRQKQLNELESKLFSKGV